MCRIDGTALDYSLTKHEYHCPTCDKHLTSKYLCPNCGVRFLPPTIIHKPCRFTEEELAKKFHYTYLRKSKEYGWSVQEETDVAFEDLPEANKKLMIDTCKEILKELEG